MSEGEDANDSQRDNGTFSTFYLSHFQKMEMMISTLTRIKIRMNLKKEIFPECNPKSDLLLHQALLTFLFKSLFIQLIIWDL